MKSKRSITVYEFTDVLQHELLKKWLIFFSLCRLSRPWLYIRKMYFVVIILLTLVKITFKFSFPWFKYCKFMNKYPPSFKIKTREIWPFTGDQSRTFPWRSACSWHAVMEIFIKKLNKNRSKKFVSQCILASKIVNLSAWSYLQKRANNFYKLSWNFLFLKGKKSMAVKSFWACNQSWKPLGEIRLHRYIPLMPACAETGQLHRSNYIKPDRIVNNHCYQFLIFLKLPLEKFRQYRWTCFPPVIFNRTTRNRISFNWFERCTMFVQLPFRSSKKRIYNIS